NNLGFGSAEETLGAQPIEGAPMNEDNVEDPSMADLPQTKVSQKQEKTVAPIDDTYPADRGFLLSFKFYQVRSIYLGQEPSCLHVHHHAPTWYLEKETTIVRDLVMLAGLDRISEISHEHYNMGLISAICENWQPKMNTFYFSWGEMTLSLDDVQHLIGLSADGDIPITEGAASQTDGKQFAAYTTPLEVVWDPYKAERRSNHNFNENTFFNRLTSSPDHVEPIYPNRIVRQFAMIQPIPKNPKCVKVSGLRTWDGEEPKQYKPKYD
ncbi:hypothetical protein GIB67_006956, partial [Kingdonia uniflora]